MFETSWCILVLLMTQDSLIIGSAVCMHNNLYAFKHFFFQIFLKNTQKFCRHFCTFCILHTHCRADRAAGHTAGHQDELPATGARGGRGADGQAVRVLRGGWMNAVCCFANYSVSNHFLTLCTKIFSLVFSHTRKSSHSTFNRNTVSQQ